MGNKGLDQQTNESPSKEVAFYKVISFPGTKVPENYKPMVYSRFLRGLRYGNDYFRMIDTDAYYKVYHAYLEALLARPDTKVNVAVLTDDDDVALGFSIGGNDRLHYVHVQGDYRGKGIGRSLTKDPFKIITHLTKQGISIWSHKCPKVSFNPWG